MRKPSKYWNRHMADIKKHGLPNDPSLNDPGFELQDLGVGGVIGFFITLIVLVILANVVIRAIYVGMDHYALSHQPAPSPLVPMPQGDMRVIDPAKMTPFPEPHLETNERTEITDFRLKEEQTLHGYAWVDQNAGTVRIPIDRAMQLIVQRGLPVKPQINSAPAK